MDDHKQITVYLPISLVDRIKIEAVQQLRQMHYSDLIESRVSQVFQQWGDIDNYIDIKNKYQNTVIHSEFIPLKRGKPCSTMHISKKRYTLYVSKKFVKSVLRFCRRYGLSRSSCIELALRVSSYENKI